MMSLILCIHSFPAVWVIVNITRTVITGIITLMDTSLFFDISVYFGCIRQLSIDL